MPLRPDYDLYNYWDAYDIYQYGAQNLNNVISRMVQENEWFLPDLLEASRPEFESWVSKRLVDTRFEQRLKNWSDQVSHDILSTIDYKHQAEINDVEQFYLPVLRGVLWVNHVALRNRSPAHSPTISHQRSGSQNSGELMYIHN